MAWLTANWVWILIAIAFVGMHMFGHGGHGSHGGHGGRNKVLEPQPSDRPDSDSPSGHQH
jgi:hypothetical protein